LSPPPFLRRLAGAVELRVKVTARARGAGLGGTVTDAAGLAWLAARVGEPAAEGRANRALLRLVATRCGVAASAVTLEAGAGSRWKRLHIAGDPAAIAARLADAAAG
jgi:uncharacterized protein YggU (UPF0235/DUF167 family)